MELRSLDKLGIKTSLLGFGCMRLLTDADGKIREKESEALLDTAYANGVNYFDTAYPYIDGQSEPFVGRVLSKYDRDSYFLATKLPVWVLKSKEDAQRIFEEQLERLRTDHVDFYLLHALNKGRWDDVVRMGVVELAEQWKKEGKIRYLGFSFHDDYEVFEEILRYRDWDFCQIQYNYLDAKEQAGDRGYALTEELGIPLVIMEPNKGGNLSNYSEDINAMFHAMDPSRSISSFAFRWVGSHPNVKVVLSGMNTMEQLQDNLKTFGDFKPLSKAEEQGIDEIVKVLKSRVQNGCTGCRYCMPCPAGVDIPGNFRIWNNYHIFRTYSHVERAWEQELKDSEKAKNCVKCGRCETLCPQKLSIRANLVQVQKDLDGKVFA